MQQQKQVKISLDEIRKNKFFVATPCYGGMLQEPYFRSVIKLLTFFNQHQIPIAFGTVANESLVTRARNVLLAYFLSGDFTHLLFIDSDIEFNHEDIVKMYSYDKDVVVGAYPKKGVGWQRIRNGVTNDFKDKNLTDREIAALGSDYAINFKFLNKEKGEVEVQDGLIKLHDAGTGFMMIKREAIMKLIKAYPEIKYNNDVNINNTEVHDKFYALFDTMIDPIDRRYLSEDYTFCRRWQDIGGDIWLDPSISLNHYGHFCFQGNPNAIIQYNPPATQPTQEIPVKDIKTLDLPD